VRGRIAVTVELFDDQVLGAQNQNTNKDYVPSLHMHRLYFRRLLRGQSGRESVARHGPHAVTRHIPFELAAGRRAVACLSGSHAETPSTLSPIALASKSESLIKDIKNSEAPTNFVIFAMHTTQSFPE
jgi:hypothetical protein